MSQEEEYILQVLWSVRI